MMSVDEVLQTLESLGSEQARKTYRRHGVKGAVFGVSYADMNKLAKKIKVNHPLAQELWSSGNHDARILATKIADPKQASSALLDSWVADLSDYVVTDALSGYIGETAIAQEKIDAWMLSSDEWIGAVGWNVLAILARNDQTLPEAYFESYISRIEKGIHASKNRTRHSMNSALIAIGMRSAALEQKSLAASTRIGKVIVDHGETNCKTPDVSAAIKKAKDRQTERV